MKNYAIIVAGGAGKRMQSEVPKQFLNLKGKPVLMHTIDAFHRSDFKPEIILVLTRHFHDYWKELCEQHQFTIPHKVVESGFSRSGSVKNGLEAIGDTGIVAIHDGVRPLVSQQIIAQAFQVADELGNAVTAVKSFDSVRLMEGEFSKVINRENIYLVQTPQAFRVELIKKAYLALDNEITEHTDDASIAEHAGVRINLVEGSHTNIKITYREDLAIAEAIINIPH